VKGGGGVLDDSIESVDAGTATGGGGPDAVAGAGAAPGAAGAGDLPFTGPEHLFLFAVLGMFAMIAGFLFYKDASRRERLALKMVDRFQWRPVQGIAQIMAPAAFGGIDYTDRARFQWR
jgi:hypothetical protein